MCLLSHVGFKQNCYEVSGKRELFICDWRTREYLGRKIITNIVSYVKCVKFFRHLIDFCGINE